MDEKIWIERYELPCGSLMLGSFRGALCMCDWADARHHGSVCRRLGRLLDGEFRVGVTQTICRAKEELDEYFAGVRREFDLPLLFAGSEFQQRVWGELQKIGYGQTMSYGEMAARMGIPTAVRALANATGANAMSIFVPCHRVVSSKGALTGYAGGLAAKDYLLRLEKGDAGLFGSD